MEPVTTKQDSPVDLLVEFYCHTLLLESGVFGLKSKLLMLRVGAGRLTSDE